MQAPCLKCENAGCGNYHDECEAYRAFKEEQEAVKKRKSLIMKLLLQDHTDITK